tara:strand:+ start:586 stop:1083 length:498 start_codon:yes stop_codon:yes gene_type:complete
MNKLQLQVEANSPFNDGWTREFYQQQLDNMEKKVDTKKYVEFVNAVTSQPSKDNEAFIYRLQELEGQGFRSERLLTASVGMCAEAGEFTEVVKKIIFQGKPVNEENLFHLKRELGDIMWYVAQACMGLGTSLDEIMEMNVDKLVARYPGGEFDVHYSENRKEGDL